MMRLLFIWAGIAFLVTRAIMGFTIAPGTHTLGFECFKDAAHIYMGALGAVVWLKWHTQSPDEKSDAVNYFILFVLLCVVEVAAAIIGRLL
jgi:hypothetical protein